VLDNGGVAYGFTGLLRISQVLAQKHQTNSRPPSDIARGEKDEGGK